MPPETGGSEHARRRGKGFCFAGPDLFGNGAHQDAGGAEVFGSTALAVSVGQCQLGKVLSSAKAIMLMALYPRTRAGVASVVRAL